MNLVNKLLLTSATLMVSTIARANIECVSADRSTKVLVIQKYDGNPVTVSLIKNSVEIYSKIPVVASAANGVSTFESPEFRNRNNAPASLRLEVYQDNGNFVGTFSEVSFLPAVASVDLSCI